MGTWVQMRSGLGKSYEAFSMSRKLGVTPESLVLALLTLADWFHRQGKHGTMVIDNKSIDRFSEIHGFADALEAAGWIKSRGEVRYLHWFCNVSAVRKSLGRKVREQALSTGRCAACGSTEDLCIDHIIPICRGGSCEVENLQALCFSCNARKGRKTMDEFMSGEAA